MSHEVEVVDNQPTDVGMKIFIEVKIDGEKCGHDSLDGEVHEFNFDVDYERYRDNEKVLKDARTWASKIVNKRVEECDSSESPVGKKVSL